MSPDLYVILSLGTDDDKDRKDGYTAKYVLLCSEQGFTVNYNIGCIANAPHTTQTPLHAAYWNMLIAHALSCKEIF